MIKNLIHLVIHLIRHPGRTLLLPLKIMRLCRVIAPIYSPKYPLVLLRAVRLYFEKGYKPEEALLCGLLEPDCSESQISKFVSTIEMLKIQKTLNPETWRPTVENKGIFYRYCDALGFPVPELYALFFKEAAGYATEGSYFRSRDAWREFIDTKLPSTFVVKPARCGYGVGIAVFERDQERGFIDAASGELYKADDLYERMRSFPYDDAFVIQERLRNHPDLVRLSGTPYLQTIRVLTYVDRHGRCRIQYASLKVIVGRNVIDNLQLGKTGNMPAPISLENGILRPAVTNTPNVSGFQTVFFHPDTGVPFEGFPVPLWEEACVLVRAVALKFLPLRTVGWDIALTPDGPYIVEGNWNAGPPVESKMMDVITATLREDEQVGE